MRFERGRVLPIAAAGVLCAWLVSLPVGAQSTAPRGSASNDTDHLRARQEWFYRQRRFPLERIPGGARQFALEQREAMRQALAQRAAQAALAGSPAPVPASSLVNPAAVWTPIGPAPTFVNGPDFFGATNNLTPVSGRVTTLAVDPVNSAIVYLGGADGGLWKSIDFGADWTPLTDAQPSLAMGAIAIDASVASCSSGACQTIYAATGEENFAGDNYFGAGILKSTDGGTTFQQLGTAGTVTSNNPKITSFVGPFNQALGGTFVSDLVINPANSNLLLASVQIFINFDSGVSSGLYCSQDAGAHWTQVISGAAGTAAVYDPGGTTAYAALGTIATSASGEKMGSPSNGVYVSANANQNCGQQTWSLVSGFPVAATAAGRISLGYAPAIGANPATLYAAVANASDESNTLNGVFKSTNGGANWTTLTSNLPVNSSGKHDFCSPQCYYDMVVKVHPANPNIVLLGGSAEETLLMSTDGGNSWTPIDFDGVNQIHVDQHTMAFSPPTGANAGTTLFVGNDGGVWNTPMTSNPLPTASTISWNSLNASLALSQFYPGISIHPSSQFVAIAGFQDNGAQKYEAANTGSAWTQTLFADGGYTYIDPVNPATVYATTEFISGKSFFLGKSPIGGDLDPGTGNVSFASASSGISVNDTAEFIPPLAGDPTPGNNAVLYLGTCNLYQTVNGAASWAALPAASLCAAGTADYTSIAAAADGNTVYAGDSSGHVHMSSNASAGATSAWSDVSAAPLPFSTSPSTGRAIVKVAVSPNNAQLAIVAYSGFCGFVDNAGHIFETTNGGNSWTDISGNGGGCSTTATPPAGTLPNTPVNDVVFDPLDATNSTIYIATDVGVFYTANSGTTWAPLGTGLPDGAVVSLTLRNASRTLLAGLHGRGAWELQLPFSAAQIAYSLVSLGPVSAVQGASNVTLMLSGMGFSNGDTVNFGATQLTPSQITPTQITVSVPGAQLAATGSVAVTVSDAANGVSNALMFSVTPNQAGSAPTLSSIMPNSGQTGSTVNVTLTGTNFDSTLVVDTPTGITASNVMVTPPSTATATLVISGSAALGANPIAVTTENGNSSPVTFTVTQGPPSLNSISPAGGAQGGTVNVTLKGQNFIPGATINVPSGPTGFTVSNLVVVSSTTITATFAIAGNSPLGADTISVTTNAGTSGSVPFSVVGPPTFTSIMPSVGAQGSTVAVTLTGTNFISGSPVTISFPCSPAPCSSGITPNNVVVQSSTVITATFVISSTATLGPQDVTITQSGLTVPTPPQSFVTFTVNLPTPLLTSISPVGGTLGNSALTVTLTGTNFSSLGSTPNIVVAQNGGITVSGVTVSSNTSITAMFAIAMNAPSGTQNISLMGSNGISSNAIAFGVGTDFTMTATTATPSPVAPGSSATSVITITPNVSGSFFPATMSFACSAGLPNLSSCNFTPPTVSASQGVSATVTVEASVQTTAPTAVGPRPPGSGPQGIEPWTMAGLAVALALLLFFGRRRAAAPAWRYAAAVLLIAAMAGMASGCHHSTTTTTTGTPNGTYTITVTATSGSAVETTSFTLKVKS